MKNSFVLSCDKEQRLDKVLLENLKDNLPDINFANMIEDMNKIKDNASSLTNIDITTMNTETVANVLDTIKNTETFTKEFSDDIVSNLLNKVNTDAQANTLLATEKKTEICP